MNQRGYDDMIRSLLESFDQERQRVATQIDESVQQKLAALFMTLDVLKAPVEKLEVAEQDLFLDSLTNLTDIIAELRTISGQLVPGSLRRFGLTAAVAQTMKEFGEKHAIIFSFHQNIHRERFSPEFELGIFKITQVAVANAIEHANAQNVTVKLIKGKELLSLTIEDDGVGFDLKDWRANKKGFGLRNIESRVSSQHGNLQIDTSPGHGTRITVQFPL